MKFRSGVFRSLKNTEFQRFREDPQHVTTLLGGAFWGSFFTGFFLWLFVGGIAFVSVWSVSGSSWFAGIDVFGVLKDS